MTSMAIIVMPNYICGKKKSTNVARNYIDCCGGDVVVLRVQAIEKVKLPKRGGDAFGFLCKRGVYWVFQLQTHIPMGFNFGWDDTHFYE